MKFSQDFIERVQEANNLVDIISQYTQLKSSGTGLMGRCPFPDHQEKTPSFSVSDMKQVYHCFGCQKKGNIFTFLADYSGMNFPEAVEYLANRAGIAMPEPPKNENQPKGQIDFSEKKKLLIRVNKLAAIYFYETFRKLPSDHPAKVYTRKRGLTEETIQTFKIGYASEEWEGLLEYLKSKNVPIQLAEDAGLIRPRKEGKSGHFDLFRDRLMFTIFSMMGDVVGFGGRVLNPENMPKYLNSPDSPAFNKGKLLYGLDQTARYIRPQDQIIVVEGYMDLVALYQAGIRNVGATLGTALTLDHGKLIKRMTKNVVVLFDGDSAGRNAAERSLPILLQAGLYPKGLVLPDNQDPDDFVKSEGAADLTKLIEQSQELFILVLKSWLEGYKSTASEKMKVADQLKPIFMSIDDRRLYELYLKDAAQYMGVDVPWFRDAIQADAKTMVRLAEQKNTVENQVVKLTEEPSQELISLKGLHQAESILLGLALKNKKNLDKIIESKVLDRILHTGLLQIFQRIQEVTGHYPEKFDKLASLLSSQVDEPSVLIAPLTNSVMNEAEGETKLLLDCMKRIHDRYLKAQAMKLEKEIKAESSSEKLEKLMNIHRDRLANKKNDSK